MNSNLTLPERTSISTCISDPDLPHLTELTLAFGDEVVYATKAVVDDKEISALNPKDDADDVELYSVWARPQSEYKPENIRISANYLDKNQLIGLCSVYHFTPSRAQPLWIEIGITIFNRSYWNSGYGTDTINQLAEFLIRRYSPQSIKLKVLQHNLRAIRCYEKCGFVFISKKKISDNIFNLMERY